MGAGRAVPWLVAILAASVIVLLAWTRWRDAGVVREGAADEGDAPSMVITRQSTTPRIDLSTMSRASIRGVVRTRGGGPIGGAQVCAWGDASVLRGLGDRRPSCATSGKNGIYRIDGLWPVATRVHASAPGHVPERWRGKDVRGRWVEQVELAAGSTREGVDLELEPGGVELRGVVKDIAGGEIEGAIVSVSGGGFYGRDASAIAVTDADGRFTTWTRRGRVLIEAVADGYAEGTIGWSAPGAPAEVLLTPESVLIGRVVDAETGEPVASASVSAMTTSGLRGAEATVRSDDEGQFQIGGLLPGMYKPTAETEDRYGEAVAAVHLGLGQTSEPVEIRTHSAAAIDARVVVAGTDEGCPAAKVRLSRAGEDESAKAIADQDGSLVLHHVSAGEYTVVVDCAGMVSEASYPALVVGHERLSGVTWEVREGLTIRGEVVDSRGAAVAGQRVSARMVVDAINPRAQSTDATAGPTGPDGAFELSGLLPGRYEVSCHGRLPCSLTPLDLDLTDGADRSDVRIELPATGVVAGRVVDEHGVAQVGLSVGATGLASMSGDAFTDERGAFELLDLPVGETRVIVSSGSERLRKPGSAADERPGEPVEVLADQRVDVELVVERRDGVIRGTVVDETGGPVSDAFVAAVRMSESVSPSRMRSSLHWDAGLEPKLTEPDGSFVLEQLSEGSHTIRAYRRGGGEAIADSVATGTSVELTIGATARLEGVVRVAGGEAPERFEIDVTDHAQGIHVSDSFFQTEGAWAITELPPGSYEVVATSSIGTGSLEVELSEGAIRDGLELTLQPRVRVTGRLVDFDTKQPIAGLRVQADGGSKFTVRGGDEVDKDTVSDSSGRFTIADAPSGSATLRVFPQSTSAYGFISVPLRLSSTAPEQDVGDIELVASRLAPGEKPGDVGFTLRPNEPGIEPEQAKAIVGQVRVGGPAEAAGLAVGDEIETINGISVTGGDGDRFRVLTTVVPGTALEVGLTGGERVSLTVGRAH